MLLRLGERNSDSLEWLYRKIRNYGPKDQGFLDSDDLDMLLEIATWVADQRKAKGEAVVGSAVTATTDDGIAERDLGPGRRSVYVQTDPTSWNAMVKAIDAGKSWEEALEALDSAVPGGDDEAREAERLMRDILGPAYRP